MEDFYGIKKIDLLKSKENNIHKEQCFNDYLD